jgi:sugar phosphate permease
MGMWAVPIYVGRIFAREITEAGNHAQEVSAAIQAEYVFILLGIVAIAVALMLFFSSKKHPELNLDKPAA